MIPSFLEDRISQIPALQVLMNMGWTYICPEETFRLRGSKVSNCILDEILQDQLQKMNVITLKGKQYRFSNVNISKAVDALRVPLVDGLIKTNEAIYDLLSLGKSFEETIGGDTKSFQLQYIDWINPENNVYHVTAEFPVDRSGSDKTRRPDIALFINGIPVCIIECKRPDIKDPIGEAVSQHISNQREDEIPGLFIYSQLLLALSPNGAKYGTTGTPAKFWAVWKEREDTERQVWPLINTPLSKPQKELLFSGVFADCRDYFENHEAEGQREIREQDKALYCLCQKERLLEIMHQFIVYDAGEKKIARYQQYFAVKNTISRITSFDKDNKRQGGVIWHTQGSGKSITMVMLAKALALEPSVRNPRIIVVTDRINLDEQIHETFMHCGKDPQRAATGRHLIELIEGKKESIITTVLDKFDSALNTKNFRDEGTEIFVLVDESHRGHYGSMHTKMRKVFPNACYVGFTGTPLLKKDKSTAIKFGGFIEPKYTIDQAVEDKAVVRLLYEGRHAVQEVDQTAIDSWFERISRDLSPEQKADLKKKFSNADHLNKADQKIYRIAYDISDHYEKNWKGTGFKAQLVAPSKPSALKYKKYLDEFGMVTSEVLISGPDVREDNEEIDEDPKNEVRKFWDKMMKRFSSSEKEYNKQVINKFKYETDPEIIIVVSKLLTGFDAPRNTVLYLTKPLKEHSLLQAIARVNRLYEGKDYGYILDYYGVLGELNEALTSYRALEGFDQEDIKGSIINVWEEVKTLKQKHSALWDVFKTIKNRMDEEEYEQLLADEQLRDQFYRRLSEYARTLTIALSTVIFLEETPERTVEMYKRDLHFFQKLRVSVKKRYAEEVDYKEYEKKIQKLIDTYIKTEEILQITPLVDIFDKEKFEEEVNKLESPRARADTIANRTKKTITEKFDEDPAFYKKFSKLLEETIEEFMAKRLSDAQYLKKVTEIMNAVRNRTGDETPELLKNREVAKAFYGIVYEVIEKFDNQDHKAKEFAAEVGLNIDDIIQENLIVDWINNSDIQNMILNKIEDYLYAVKDKRHLNLTFDEIDSILEQSLKVAKKRYAE